MKPVKAVYAPLACMEDDDDDALNQPSSPSSPTIPSAPSSLDTSTSASPPLSTTSDKNAQWSLIDPGQRWSDTSREPKRCDTSAVEEQDDSTTRTALLPESSASEASRGKRISISKTDDFPNRKTFQGLVARVSSAAPSSDDDSVDPSLRSVQFCDSASAEASGGAESPNGRNDRLPGKLDFQRGDDIWDYSCRDTCPRRRAGEERESGDRETGTVRLGVKNSDGLDSLDYFRSEERRADFSPPVCTSGEYTSFLPPAAADVSRIRRLQERRSSSSEPLPDNTTASRQHWGGEKSSKADSKAVDTRKSVKHSEFSLATRGELRNSGEVPRIEETPLATREELRNSGEAPRNQGTLLATREELKNSGKAPRNQGTLLATPEELKNSGEVPRNQETLPVQREHETSQEWASSSRTGHDTDDIVDPPKDGNDDVSDDEDLQSGLELFLPRRRKHLRVSRARLVAFLLKYILFLLNFLFWVTSVAAIVMGAWVLSERGHLVRDSASFFLDPSAMLCLLGALTFLVAFCGCLGALRENIRLLKVFQFSMLVVLVLEALVALMVFAFYQIPEFRGMLKAGPEEVLTIAIRRYHDDEELRRWIDLIQTEFKCCGARHSESGYLDWQQNAYFNCTPDNPSAQRCGVPRSCCIIEPGEYINYMCGFDTTNKARSQLYDRINTQGCMKGLGEWMSAHDVIIGAVSLAIIVPQILSVVFARLLVQHIQRQRVRWRVLRHEK